MFTLSFGILVISVLKSFEVLAQIPTNSINYWIWNISPRCAINIIYYELTNDLVFNSVRNIPVMLAPVENNHYIEYAPSDHYLLRFKEYLENHKFYNISLRFMKAECYFSILYFKSPNNFDDPTSEDIYLYSLINYIAHGFSYAPNTESNSTYCLILYHGTPLTETETDYRLETINEQKREINLALVYLSNSSKTEYNVYCRTPSLTFQVAAYNV